MSEHPDFKLDGLPAFELARFTKGGKSVSILCVESLDVPDKDILEAANTIGELTGKPKVVRVLRSKRDVIEFDDTRGADGDYLFIPRQCNCKGFDIGRAHVAVVVDAKFNISANV